ncbi:MAG: efflux RND transporter periplasmic adaptor subunit [Cytophagales bacterium]|nr:efflux RND transporter periplasmic adaptor subunit [Cytophagales bacterium]
MRTNSILITAGVIAIMAVACGKKEDASGDKKAQLEALKKQQAELTAQIKKLESEIVVAPVSAENDKTKMVVLTEVQAQPFNHYIQVQGKVETDKNLSISAVSGGTITKVYVKKGDNVSKGQLLAQLDADVLLKSIEEVKQSLNFANDVYGKQAALWEQKIGSEIQYLTAKNNKETIEKRLATLQEQFQMSKITAPASGIIDDVYRKEGELAGPGIPIFRLVNSSDLKVTAEIAEAYLGKVNEGDKVEITFPDLEKKIVGRISNIGGIINAMTRSFVVEIALTQQIANVKPNMLAILNINDYKKPNAIVVPVNVVQNSPDGQFVFLANGNKAEKRIVEVKNVFNAQAEIASGISVGEKLITVGYNDLVNGEVIKF